MKSIVALSLILTLGRALAQDAVGADATAQQLVRIQSQREQDGARYAREEQACALKFAVSDCLRSVKERQRRSQADLRRDEIALNDAQRRQRSRGTLEHASQADLSKGIAGNESSAERLRLKTQEVAKRDEEARTRSARLETSRALREQSDAKRSAQTAQQARTKVLQQQKRRSQAEQHKAQVQARQAGATKPGAAKPLPADQ